MGDEIPFYSNEDVRKGIEKIKTELLNKESNIALLHSAGFWKFISPILDCELLTYEQKKMVARELFPIVYKDS
ncbi:MAG: hypothetical protein ABIL39_10360 [candidate division WOR-3 bacterium]